MDELNSSSSMYQKIIMARQPIYDVDVNIVAYELLFRNCTDNQAVIIDGDGATSELLVNLYTHFDVDEVVGGKKAYINFTKKLIEDPPPFDKKGFVVEVLEDIVIDDDLVENLTKLADAGYTIALDDYIHNEQSHRILPLVDIVKIDVLELDGEELERHVQLLRQYDVTLLAEKVETHDMYKRCSGLGFELFQGYFLCKPQMISGKKVPASKLLVIELLGKLQNPETTNEELEALVSRDPVLSFQLLKLVNSACYMLNHKIESLARAITYLGLNQVRSLASLLTLSNLSDKPSALKHQSIIRAKMCELLGAKIIQSDASVMFSVGLLSTLDAYFDQPLEKVIASMPLREDLVEALLNYSGVYGDILRIVIALERAEVDGMDWSFLSRNNVTAEDINEIYQESIVWCHTSGF
jgi:EAL and modified HD-GYP domain-containing signal transduction protein